METHIGIIGGGILGIALARALALKGEHRITVLEKESAVAQHQTGRNSGVVHAGLYYQPGSLKAGLCARGRAMTREYCQQHSLPYRELGKLVVALDEDQLPRLADMELRATANKVPGLARLNRSGFTEIEPHVNGIAALHSPHTASVDYSLITQTMASEVIEAGGEILFDSEIIAVNVLNDACSVSTNKTTHRFDRLIVCAGLQSDVIAKMVGADPSPKILPFRGEYWVMSQSSASLVKGMIYPVPDPRFPFLGVHFTRGVNDEVNVGPNAVPALAREGYNWRTFSLKDTMDSLRWPGAPSLARKYWKMGAMEIGASLIKSLYLKQTQMFLPQLTAADLQHKGQAGVRAQAWSKDGSLLDDFAVDQVGAVTVLRNAPSPAATSAMAIADYVLEKYFVDGHRGK